MTFVCILLGVGTVAAHAQFRSDSETVTTTVGTPLANGGIAACPIPNGVITCGSKNVPVNGCGHCGVGYEAYMSGCTYEGINYAMDIGGTDFQDVILPSVGGAAITWTFVAETNRTNNQAIQRFGGTNEATGDKYWIQFHHTQPGSGNVGTHTSGERGANICGNGCNAEHVHVEFAKVDSSGKNIWQDAPNYFCR